MSYLPIFSRSPEPKPGNVLYYSQAHGTLQAVDLRPDLPKGLWTMPVTERDNDVIVGYCYHNNPEGPDYLWKCQWVAVPYNGGPVQRRISVSALLQALPEYVATVTFNNCSYDRAYQIGGALAQQLSFAQVQYPTIISGTSNVFTKMLFRLPDAEVDKFVAEFTANYTQVGVRNFTITLEKRTPENWKI
jgi:hypothetical protein